MYEEAFCKPAKQGMWALRSFVATIVFLLIGFQAFAGPPKVQTAGVQLSNANQIVLKKPPCRPPKKTAYSNWFGTATFTLADGDVGTCQGDNRTKKSFNPPAPYAERVETGGHTLQQGGRYLFSGYFNFDPAFKTAPMTTFFKVNQWHSKNCRCAPYLSIVWGQDGALYAYVLKKKSVSKPFRLGGWRRSDFEHRWVEIAIDIDTSEKQLLTIYVAGKPELTTGFLAREGGTVTPRFGLFRPGRVQPPLPTDRLHVRSLRMSRLKQ